MSLSWLVGWSVCHNIVKGGELHFHASIAVFIHAKFYRLTLSKYNLCLILSFLKCFYHFVSQGNLKFLQDLNSLSSLSLYSIFFWSPLCFLSDVRLSQLATCPTWRDIMQARKKFFIASKKSLSGWDVIPLFVISWNWLLWV